MFTSYFFLSYFLPIFISYFILFFYHSTNLITYFSLVGFYLSFKMEMDTGYEEYIIKELP